MNLYWCETSDHDEDWFIVARSAREARKIHADEEGYEPTMIQATLVQRIPKEIAATQGWPDHELLLNLGAVFLCEKTPRIVQIGSVIYKEGGMDGVLRRLEDDQSEVLGKGRPNGTTKLM